MQVLAFLEHLSLFYRTAMAGAVWCSFYNEAKLGPVYAPICFGASPSHELPRTLNVYPQSSQA